VRAILRAALAALPPVLGGPPAEPLDLGRATRTISPAQRRALAIRDGGCRFPGCSAPPIWCDGHHVIHWLDGGRTDLANLVLLCRRHHRAVHEGGWTIHSDHHGRVTFLPPAREVLSPKVRRLEVLDGRGQSGHCSSLIQPRRRAAVVGWGTGQGPAMTVRSGRFCTTSSAMSCSPCLAGRCLISMLLRRRDGAQGCRGLQRFLLSKRPDLNGT